MEIQGRLIKEILNHFSSKPTFTLRELAEYTNLPREDAQAISEVMHRKGVIGLHKTSFRVTKSGKTYLSSMERPGSVSDAKKYVSNKNK